MNFNEEMETFFSRYSETDRKLVESWPPYQEAAKAENVALAQAIACEQLEGIGRTKQEAQKDREEKLGTRLFAQF